MSITLAMQSAYAQVNMRRNASRELNLHSYGRFHGHLRQAREITRAKML